MKTRLRNAARAAGVSAAALGLLVLGGGVASAHVTVTPDTTTAGSYAVLTFAIPHGCDDSATTEVAIKIPDGISSVTPTVNPGWTIEKKMEALDPPVDDGHGGQLTERIDQVVYTAKTALPDGIRDTFALSLKLPDTVGQDLIFPAVQTCEQGEVAWVQVAEAGQDEPDLPAPFITLTAAGSAAAADSAASDAEAETATPADTSSEPESASSSGVTTVSWAALVLGALGAVLGGVALIRTRQTP